MSNDNHDDDALASPLPSPSITTTTTTVITSQGSSDRLRADGAPPAAADSRTTDAVADPDHPKTVRWCVVPRPGEKPVCGRLVRIGGAHVGPETDDESDPSPPDLKRRR